jgi:hypothetical protein
LLVREMSGSTFRPPSDGSQVSIAWGPVSGKPGVAHLSCLNDVYSLSSLGKRTQIHTNDLNRNRSVRFHCILLSWEICVCD